MTFSRGPNEWQNGDLRLFSPTDSPKVFSPLHSFQQHLQPLDSLRQVEAS